MDFSVNNQPAFGRIKNDSSASNTKVAANFSGEESKDVAEFSTKKDAKDKKLKQFAKYMLVSQAVTAAVVIAGSIGRNPAKAAKVLRGTSNIVQPAYNKGAELLDTLMAKTGDFKTSFDDILNMFKPEKNSTKLADALDDVEALIKESGLEPDAKITDAISSLRENLNKFTGEIQEALSRGENVSIYDKTREFETSNSKMASIIEDFLDDFKYNKMDFKARYSTEGEAVSELGDIFGYRLSNAAAPKNIITECPKDVLDITQTFYHGTRNSGKVYKNGFTPYVSNQLTRAPRELGAGIYTTPDKRVAASFTQFAGNIIPVKLDADAKVAFMDENNYNNFANRILKFLNERMPQSALDALPKDEKNAMIELLYQKAFKDAGYDAVYIPKGVQAGLNLFGGNVNEMCGVNQSQLVIFSPEKLEISPRGLKERLLDVGTKFKALMQSIKYAKEHPLAGLGL